MQEAYSPIDEVFYNCDTDTTHQQIASFCLLEGLPDFERFREDVLRVTELFPRMRRVVVNGPGFHWKECLDFNIDEHVCREIDPSIKSKEDLLEVVSKSFSAALELDRPLWRFTLVTNGLSGAGGVSGVLFSLHHTLTDGVGGLELIRTLFSHEQDTPAPMKLVERKNSERSGGLMGSLMKINWSRSFAGWFNEFFSPHVNGPINGANSSVRNIAATELDLTSLRQIRKNTGASLNDVIFAIVGGAVSKYLENHCRPVKDMRVIMPVSLRTVSERYALGNKLTGVGVPIPVAAKTARDRLEAAMGILQELKAGGVLGAYAHMAKIISKMPVWFQRKICEAQARRTNFIITNMPGEKRERYLAGARVLGNYGLAALMKGHGVSFGFIRYRDKICASVVGDSGIVDDPWVLAECLERSALELSGEVGSTVS
jgi:NRPS condensation-like uncharacterized protein